MTESDPKASTPPKVGNRHLRQSHSESESVRSCDDQSTGPPGNLTIDDGMEESLENKKIMLQQGNDESNSKPMIRNPFTTMRSVSPLNSVDLGRSSASPHRTRHPYMSPSSPGRAIHTSSPRMHSPASSQIFERSVQEDIAPAQTSPSIPSHIMTENHIPPILEASSAAITDDRLDPDSVEIITHSFHQPASLTVTGGGPIDYSMAPLWHEDGNSHPALDPEDSASNYGALDGTDVRRLSFISFADVVHAEHAESGDHGSNRDSLCMAGLSANPTALAVQNRSPSPVRSPVSSHGFGTSPPTSVSPSCKGIETSPNRGAWVPGSPLPHSPPLCGFAGELNVETMRQALRRTGSGDLSGIRSQPMSAVGNEDGTYDRPFK
jgi:hypothetical protein